MAAVLALSSCLAACGSEETSQSLDVPVLWVATGDSGESGGTSPVTITVTRAPRSSGVSPFSVDLRNEEAQGAGAQWLAASANAATTGTLLSGADPSGIEIAFDIESAIDGSSAGGLLGVGVIALQRGVSVRDTVTMTGTLNPDGGIGHVSGVGTKIRAAAAAGFEQVLVPSSTTDVTDSETGELVDPVELGQTVGITVTKVGTVGEAYRQLTGQELVETGLPTPPIDASLTTAVATRAEQLGEELGQELAQASDSTTKTAGATCLAAGTQELRAGDSVDAYSKLWLCARTYRSGIARAEVASRIEAGSATDVQQQLAAAATTLAADARTSVGEPADLVGLGAAGYVAAASILTLPIETYATSSAYADTLAGDEQQSDSSLESYAGAIAEQQFNLTTTFPDSQYVLQRWTGGHRSAVSDGSGTQPETQAFFSGYTDFLFEAAQANMAYYESVVRQVSSDETRQAALEGNSFYRAAVNVGTMATQIRDAGGSDFDTFAAGVSYYLNSAAIVSAESGFGAVATSGAGDVAVATRQALQASIDTSAAAADSLAAVVSSRAIDPSYAQWDKQWGVELNAAPAQEQRTNEALTGMTYVWRAALQLRMLDSSGRSR